MFLEYIYFYNNVSPNTVEKIVASYCKTQKLYKHLN